MLSVNNLDIRYGDKHLFKDISLQVYDGNRIGLIGVNGTGKSTLMKIMAGIQESDDQVVQCGKRFTVAYLPQESSVVNSKKSLYDEAKTAFSELLALQDEVAGINDKLEQIPPHSSLFDSLIARQGEIQHLLESSDIYTIQAKIEKVLFGLGFSRQDLAMPASSFSGGWIMRLMLAKLLLAAPSLLLLDEPTNHLDLESLTWIEDFLRSYHGAMVIISHDRTFLDRTTGITWELSLGRLHVFKGNYSYYVREKAERRVVERAAYDNQQAKIKQTMQFVQRFRAKSTKASQVQSRLKLLDKMDMIELAEEERQVRFTFPPAPPSGRDVLQVSGLSMSYKDKQVFHDVDIQLQRGDKVAVVGVNGAGKSTFLKILSGMIKQDSGQVQFGHNVELSYFGQHQAMELSPSLTALDTIAATGEDMTITRMRSLLGAFLFRGEEVDKKVQVLSGGEKSRLALARMIAVPANCMLLDEPTNHLDMSSQEVLQEAMKQYGGTVVVVSHNRYFLDAFVTRVLEVKAGVATLYEGNVSEYLRRIKEQQEQSLAANNGKQASSVRDKVKSPGESRKEKKKNEAVIRQKRNLVLGPWKKKEAEAEEQIDVLEQQKEALETAMADPDLYKDEDAWSTTSKDYDVCTRRLERLYERWEKAQEEIEKLEQQLLAE